MTTRRSAPSSGGAGDTIVADEGGDADVNEVRLVGRVSGMPQTRLLPSGDELVHFRLVVRRSEPAERKKAGPAERKKASSDAPASGDQTRGAPTVDTLDIACWSGRARQRARPLVDGDRVRVAGVLRRRFFRVSGAPSSRYEVAAEVVSRVR